MATQAASEPVQPSVASRSRKTRGGRTLWYQLSVLQQPERARACGSGLKANSDRRPVDPPPVVELRIIEGNSIQEGKDITFDYNANFFLYASLEHARPVCHGRVHNAATSNPPILTGVPASGMAYLDRPTEAGYFIFPDLSVRHEGYYKLSFSLFETTKEEKDFDFDQDLVNSDLPPGVDFRMEIETQPFHVYSAKKFPGLMESTQLSKTVADQGCRVRIRRDVRMRKRDGKGNGYERREEEYTRHRTVTPVVEDPHGLRPRSVSNSSEHRAPYPQDTQRRPSIVDVPTTYPPPPPPVYDPAANACRSHLSFGDAGAPQYATPRQYAPPPQAAVPVSPGGPYNAQPPYTKVENAPYGYSSARNMSQSSVASSQPIKPDYPDRRMSMIPPPSPSGYSVESSGRRDSLSYQQIPPTPLSAQYPRSLPPITSSRPMGISFLVSPDSQIIEPQTSPAPHQPVQYTGDKRKHESVFTPSDQSLHNGQRPQDPHYHPRGFERFEGEHGTYSRADGTLATVSFNVFHPDGTRSSYK